MRGRLRGKMFIHLLDRFSTFEKENWDLHKFFVKSLFIYLMSATGVGADYYSIAAVAGILTSIVLTKDQNMRLCFLNVKISENSNHLSPFHLPLVCLKRMHTHSPTHTHTHTHTQLLKGGLLWPLSIARQEQTVTFHQCLMGAEKVIITFCISHLLCLRSSNSAE